MTRTKSTSSRSLKASKFTSKGFYSRFIYDFYSIQNGTPFNYLDSEEVLKQRHFEYYTGMNEDVIKEKGQKLAQFLL